MSSRLMRCVFAIACTAQLTSGGFWPSLARAGPASAAPTPSAGGSPATLTGPLTLQAAIDLARSAHPDLRVAAGDLAVARADSAYARVPAFNPQLELQSARGGETIRSGAEGTLSLGVSQELELWGKRSARQVVATSRSLTSAAEWRAKLQEIESRVRARFELALFFQTRLELTDELAELDRRVVESTQARVRDGSITPVTGRLTELDLLRVEVQGRRARAGLRQALVALGLAIGRPLPAPVRLEGEFQVDSLQVPEDSVVTSALRVRATGDVLRRQIAERRAELRRAELEGRPNLTLGLGLSEERSVFTRDEFSGAPAVVGGIAGASSTDHLWSARISAPLPLWQRNQAGRARASAEISRSEADYDRYRRQTQLEVLGAVRRFEDAAGLYRLYLDRSTYVRQDLALIREAYTDGRISLDSYLTQKGRLVDTLLGELDAGDAYWDARGQLEAAAGLDLAHLNAGGAR